MSETNIQTVQIADGTLSADLLPAGWTSPVWVLWEPEEAYLTLFPSMPDASTLEDVAEYGTATVEDGVITLPFSFLSLLSDEKTYNCIIELFQLGAIKISLFGSYRTPSQYIQTSISKIKNNDSVFIFSGVPVRTDETELIQDIQNALRYTDIGIIKQRVEVAEKSGDSAEYERLVFLERYIRLILLLSGEELANVPPSRTSHKFIEYMDLILKNRQGILLNTKIVDCDYYRFLEGDTRAINSFTGQYMSAYSWAEFTVGYLENRLQKLTK